MKTAKKRKSLFFFLAVAVSFLLQTASVFALEVRDYPSVLGFSINSSSTFPEYAKYLFNLGMVIAGALALIVITFGAIYYLISFGRGKFTDEGKDWIKAGILGLFITVSAYLIAYTINPDLVVFRLGDLLPIQIQNFLNPSGERPIPTLTFTEIPIGILTENVLSNTSTCYDFDYKGDFIEGPLLTDNGRTVQGPTLVENDRVDCLLKLTQAIQAKTKTIDDLGNEIKKLMDKCSCANQCVADCKCPDTKKGAAACNNACKDSKCDAPETGKNTKPWASPYQKNKSCCSDKTKDQIEHGAIKINNCAVKANVSIELAKNADSEDTGQPCQVGSLGGIITKKRDIYIGANVNRGDVQWAIDKWNQTVADLGRDPVFGNIIGNGTKGDAGDKVVNSYCFPSGYGDECLGGTPQAPDGIDRIYSRRIDTKGQIPWQPAAFNSYTVGDGEMKRYDIDLDPGNPDTATVQNYRMVLLHELGHSMGLKDAYDTDTGKFKSECNDKSLMNNEFTMEGPGEADTDYIKKAYPAKTALLKKPFLVAVTLIQGETSGCSGTDTLDAKCCIKGKEYHGLDEFRCPNPIRGAQIKQCDNINITRERVQVNGKQISILDKNKWDNLSLVQQETYLKEQIDAIKKWIQKDLDTLNSAKSTLDGCYLSKSYADYVKIQKQTDKKDKTIVAEKPFKNPQTSKAIDIAKYCGGFNYGNSDFFITCQKICPGDSAANLKCYKNCPPVDNKCPNCSPNDTACLNEQKQCQNRLKPLLERQKKCTSDCYDSQKCIYSDNNNFGNLKQCINYYQNKCKEDCSNKYLPCSDDFKRCQAQCADNSQCIMENKDTCLIDNQNLISCAKQNKDSDMFQNCMKLSYRCQYGSSQNAGYIDCLNPQAYEQKRDFSSSSLYKNPEYQKCPNPYNLFSKNSTSICLDVYAETSKCPSSSKCPACPCGVVSSCVCPDEKTFSPQCCGLSGSSSSSGGANAAKKDYRIVTGTCTEYTYNDDPLTFYCEQNWWLNKNNPDIKGTEAIGLERFCSKSDEIPVGQTVDDTKKWVNNLFLKLDKVIKDTSDILGELKKISDKKEDKYCKCDSKLDSGNKICKTTCRWTEKPAPACITDACSKNCCQQMIDYLNNVSKIYQKLRVDEFNFFNFVTIDQRTDVLKELTYSRTKTSDCSRTENNYGDTALLLSCTRVEHELIPPVIPKGETLIGDKIFKRYCYGKELFKENVTLKEDSQPLTDNWFCCETQKNDKSESK